MRIKIHLKSVLFGDFRYLLFIVAKVVSYRMTLSFLQEILSLDDILILINRKSQIILNLVYVNRRTTELTMHFSDPFSNFAQKYA